MGRTLKISAYVALLFLGYMWIATMATSCKNTDTTSNDSEQVDDSYAEDEGFEDEFFEDGDDSNEETYTDNEMGGGAETPDAAVEDAPIDYTEVDEIIEEETKPTPAPKKTTKPKPATTSSSSGKYLLLAGSYLIEDNARTMVKKLKKLGYNNAEVVVFDMSQYYSVSAGRYNGLSSAQRESSALKRKGVDNYVHTKQ